MSQFTYYLLGTACLCFAFIIQMSIGNFIQIVSVKPALALIPLVFFTLGIYPKFFSGLIFSAASPKAGRMKFQTRWIGWYAPREMPMENLLRGLVLGLLAGLMEGMNSGFVAGSVFSWCAAGAFLGIVSGPINRDNEFVISILLFTSALIQALVFSFLLAARSEDYPLGPCAWAALVSALYTTVLGTVAIRVFEKKKTASVIRFGA